MAAGWGDGEDFSVCAMAEKDDGGSRRLYCSEGV